MIRSLFIVPAVILSALRSGILAAVKVIRSLLIVPVAILAASRSGILAAVKVIRSLFIVPVAILAASRSGILAAVKEIRSLFIVPVNLVASRFAIPTPELISFITVFIVLKESLNPLFLIVVILVFCPLLK